jgi:hypothetical protein
VAEKADLVLRPGLNRWGWVLGMAAFLVVFSGLGLRAGWPWAWLYLGMAVVLIGFTAWVMLAPRMRLRLSPSGFAYGTARRRYFFRWEDVAEFGVARFAGYWWVAFNLVPGYRGDERVRAINQEFGRFDRFLPDTYGMRAVELALLLESWRLCYGVSTEAIEGESWGNET